MNEFSIESLTLIHPHRLMSLGVIMLCAVIGIMTARRQRRWRARLFGPTAADPAESLLGVAWMIAMSMVALAWADVRASDRLAATGPIRTQVVVVLDRSRSMLARDVDPTRSRFAIAQGLIEQLLGVSPGVPCGLVTFAGESTIDVPLTRDHAALKAAVARLRPTENHSFGSHLGAAVRAAGGCFAERLASRKILIVIGDGERSPGDIPLPGDDNNHDAALFVAIGNRDVGGPIPLDAAGEFLVHGGQQVRTVARPETFQRLRHRRTDPIFQVHDLMSERQVVRRTAEWLVANSRSQPAADRQLSLADPWYNRFLIAALIACLIGDAIRCRIDHRGGFRGQPIAAVTLALAALLVFPGAASGERGSATVDSSTLSYRARLIRYNQAVAAYRAEDYESAMTGFRAGLDDPSHEIRNRSNFNLANSLVRSVTRGTAPRPTALDRLRQAIQRFEDAIAVSHRVDDARANISLARRLIEAIERQAADRPSEAGSSQTPDDPSTPPPQSQTPPPPPTTDNDRSSGDKGAHQDHGARPDVDAGSGRGRTERPAAESGTGRVDRNRYSTPPKPPSNPIASDRMLSDADVNDLLRTIRQRAEQRSKARNSQRATTEPKPDPMPW